MRRMVRDLRRQQQRFGSRDIAHSTMPSKQIAFGNTGGREDDVIAARHIVQTQYFTGFDAHRFAACQLLLANATIIFVVAFDVMTPADDRSCDHLMRRIARRGNYAFRRATNTVQHVNCAVWHTGE